MTIIYVIRYGPEGAMGFATNRVLAEDPATNILDPGSAPAKYTDRKIAIHYGGPMRGLFVLGHSVWAPGQLESEFGHDDWAIATGDTEFQFDLGLVNQRRRAYDNGEAAP